ncbi:ketosynthase chain-length factor [Kutzneria buriramensis]|uniref:Act minimal PKS chain-length factor (CLF/KS beta) n=1 Tax=Kutzneria buriramensis TaxID=1045776 RepID=A0A3E0GZ24_9PSEU|nr:ketosynthase chain-length factor [Kutzneria buriramensis]REH32558.1 act minimal PKS chain-length factor (CLF/KS beta) [Kutzneria buriramensis]
MTTTLTATEPTVVTGIGVLAPNGVSAEDYWRATLAGRTGIGRLTGFDVSEYPVRLAGQVDLDPAGRLPGRLLPQTDRVTRLALVAAEDALADAGVDPAALPEYGMGVVTSNASGGFGFTHTEIQKLWTRGPQFVSVYESFAWFYAVNTGQISIRHGMRGPSGVVVAEQAGGLDAIGHARRNLARGARLMVTGGVESSFDPWGWVSHIASGRLTTDDDPATAYRPFDPTASGYVAGEGGAILVLENESSARERDARVYGEIAGYAATFDPRPGSGRPPGLGRAARLALEQAEVSPADVQVVFADAAGTPELDRQEAEALVSLFGPYGVPVTAPKALTGRLYSGGPPLDVAAALLSIRDGVVPPTPSAAGEDYRLDLVTGSARRLPVRTALVLARGRGGFNAAAVVREFPSTQRS